jgi:LuxR family transcriptional regulator, quorum-sensing system regulator BjaR1
MGESAVRRRMIALERQSGMMTLTPRQREILIWTSHGKSSKEIGEILGITQRGLDKLLESAFHQLEVANRTHAVAIALRNKLID